MYATDTNALKTTAVPLTGHFAHGVGLVMKKAPATEGVLGGHALYGVRSSGSWLHKCARSWSHVRQQLKPETVSADARDKYFAVAVGSFGPAAGAQLRSELPGLEAADAAFSCCCDRSCRGRA